MPELSSNLLNKVVAETPSAAAAKELLNILDKFNIPSDYEAKPNVSDLKALSSNGNKILDKCMSSLEKWLPTIVSDESVNRQELEEYSRQMIREIKLIHRHLLTAATWRNSPPIEELYPKLQVFLTHLFEEMKRVINETAEAGPNEWIRALKMVLKELSAQFPSMEGIESSELDTELESELGGETDIAEESETGEAGRKLTRGLSLSASGTGGASSERRTSCDVTTIPKRLALA